MPIDFRNGCHFLAYELGQFGKPQMRKQVCTVA